MIQITTVTKLYLYRNCYLNISNKNAPVKIGITSIARAIAKFKTNFNKKIKIKGYSAFSILTDIPSSIVISHLIESPNSNSNNFNTSCGTTDRRLFGPPLLNFVLYSKIGIPPFLFLIKCISMFLSIYIYLILSYLKGYYNNLYIVLGANLYSRINLKAATFKKIRYERSDSNDRNKNFG